MATKEDLVLFQNELEDLLCDIQAGDEDRIELPQIVAVGGQSSGKSSVMEALVGHSFLPKGSGIVTRCPIVLRMVNTPGNDEWVEFGHIPAERVTDFEQVSAEIRKRTDEIAGTNKGITKDPIKLTFYSPKVLNLTIVDQPGLVENAVDDQPEEIEVHIEDLVMSYIKKEQTIILLIVPGDYDVATAKGLKLVQKVDAKQRRTIVVITKLDKVEQKTELRKMTEVLKGKKRPLNVKAPICVINKPGINGEDVSASDRAAFEQEFLQDNFAEIAKDHGTAFLGSTLNQIFRKRMAEFLSQKDILSKVRRQHEIAKKQLDALGSKEDFSNTDGKRRILIHAIDDFAKAYRAQVKGQGKGEITTKCLTRGARLNHILGQKLNEELEKANVFQDMPDEMILIAVRNAMSVDSRQIDPEVVLDCFVTKEIKEISPTAFDTANLCFQEMVVMIQQCLKDKRFPLINAEISSVINSLLEEKLQEIKGELARFFKIQSASALMTNPTHADVLKEAMNAIGRIDLGQLPVKFVLKLQDGDEKLRTLLDNFALDPDDKGDGEDDDEPEYEFTEDQKKLCEELRNLATMAYRIIKCKDQDHVIDTIMCLLINETVESAGKVLTFHLDQAEKIDDLVKERDDISRERVNLKDKVERFGEASKKIQEVINSAI